MLETVKNTIELNIYNDDLELVNTYKTYGLKWKAFKIVLAEQDKIKNLGDEEAVEEIRKIVKLIFPKISDDDLEEAYIEDLFNCFTQAVSIAGKMSKNF